jgi:hypothetical protein
VASSLELLVRREHARVHVERNLLHSVEAGQLEQLVHWLALRRREARREIGPARLEWRHGAIIGRFARTGWELASFRALQQLLLGSGQPVVVARDTHVFAQQRDRGRVHVPVAQREEPRVCKQKERRLLRAKRLLLDQQLADVFVRRRRMRRQPERQHGAAVRLLRRLLDQRIAERIEAALANALDRRSVAQCFACVETQAAMLSEPLRLRRRDELVDTGLALDRLESVDECAVDRAQHVDGTLAVARLDVLVRAALGKQLAHGRGVVVRRQDQRRAPVLVGGVDVDVAIQQRARKRDAVALRRFVQRRALRI